MMQDPTVACGGTGFLGPLSKVTRFVPLSHSDVGRAQLLTYMGSVLIEIYAWVVGKAIIEWGPVIGWGTTLPESCYRQFPV
jgi:hypothetical protein